MLCHEGIVPIVTCPYRYHYVGDTPRQVTGGGIGG